jgi:hypothetical protein
MGGGGPPAFIGPVQGSWSADRFVDDSGTAGDKPGGGGGFDMAGMNNRRRGIFAVFASHF